MTEPQRQMSEETRELLGDLTPEDVKTLRKAIPIFRAILGFGRVTMWLSVTALGLLAAVVLAGESIQKILSWFWPPPPSP